jgi:hypothetical protein
VRLRSFDKIENLSTGNLVADGIPKAFARELHRTGRLIATIAHPHLSPFPNKERRNLTLAVLFETRFPAFLIS